MTLVRCSLVLAAIGFAAFGVWLLVAPQALGEVGVVLSTPAARAEIRAFYGGLELGLAAFFAVAAARPAWFAPALLAQALGLGGVVLEARPSGADGWLGRAGRADSGRGSLCSAAARP